MKKFIVLIIFTLAISLTAFAESPLAELDKIKKIKLLESTAEDVKKIFDDNDEDSDGDYYVTDNFRIEITYSEGDCFEEDGGDDWNVPKGKAVEIGVIINDPKITNQLKIDFSKLEKINENEDDDEIEERSKDFIYEGPKDFIYYDKENGISYDMHKGKIKNIKFMPAEKNFPSLCNNEDFREFTSTKEWFIHKIKDRPSIAIGCPKTNVSELVLSKSELKASCVKNKLTKVCAEDSQIEVAAQVENYLNAVLTYQYTVSGGKIIGNGATVTWDLTGVKPGEYTITAAVDDGCGFCGKTVTEKIVVKDCPCCKPDKK